MLRFLRIRNLAVIESVDVEFEPGFNVLTGETGAGKSIVVEAVGLLLGARASADLVRTGETQASIEAIFEEAGAAGAEPHELVIRRDISSQGRSRSFINGALATAAALRDLSQRLVELHGQHEHQALLDPTTHLPLLDTYAGLASDAQQVAAAWNDVRGAARAARPITDGRTGEECAARLDCLPARRRSRRPHPRRGRTRSLRRQSRCSPAPSGSSACARSRTRRSTRATPRYWPVSAACGSGSGSWRQSIRNSLPI